MKDQKKVSSLYVLKRLLTYMVKNYKFSFFIVVVCIVISAVATMQGMLFVQSLVDDYIVPLLDSANPDFKPLAWALTMIVGFYIVGVAASYAPWPGEEAMLLEAQEAATLSDTLEKIREGGLPGR